MMPPHSRQTEPTQIEPSQPPLAANDAPTEASAVPPPLWAALVGGVVGLVSVGAVDAVQVPTTLTWPAPVLVLAWTLGLGAVFLDIWGVRGRLAALLGLGLLTALVAGSHPWRLHFGFDENVLVTSALFAFCGVALLHGWQGGRRVEGGRSLAFLTSFPLLFMVAGTLGLLFFGLIQLAGALADAVGVSAVQSALGNKWVAVPLVLSASAFFVAALRSARWGQALTRTLGSLLAYLLPVAALVVALFVALLPFAAFQDSAALYGGFLNSHLYLALAAAFSALVLYAYQAEAEAKMGDVAGAAAGTASTTLPPVLAQFSRVVAYLLPLFPLLAVYGLIHRVSAYGFTDSRVLGLSLAFWGLLFTVGLALTRRRPPFWGLTRLLPVALAGLAVICALLSIPTLRPADIALRSQLAVLSRAELEEEQARSALAYLLQGGTQGKQAVARLERASLSDAARAELTKLDELGEAEYLGRRAYVPPKREYRFEPLEGSAALLPAQAEALEAEFRAAPQDNYHILCELEASGRPGTKFCEVSIYLLPLEGGGTRALLPMPFPLSTGDPEGRWFDLTAPIAGSVTIVRGGPFGRNASSMIEDEYTDYEDEPDWAAGVQVRTVQREVLQIDGHEVPMQEGILYGPK